MRQYLFCGQTRRLIWFLYHQFPLHCKRCARPQDYQNPTVSYCTEKTRNQIQNHNQESLSVANWRPCFPNVSTGSLVYFHLPLEKAECKSPNHQGQVLTLDDLAKNALATEILGEKQEMLWKIFPRYKVIPVLRCEISTVNDQLYKNCLAKYCQLIVDHRKNLRSVLE